MKNSNNLMYFMLIGGISIAIALGGAGLGIALKNDPKTINSIAPDANSPYKYGKLDNWNIPNAAKVLSTAADSKLGIDAFEANDEKTIVDTGFWTKIVEIKAPVEKVTTGIKANGAAKNAAGYTNVITFALSSTDNLANSLKEVGFVVTQKWNDKGEVVYTLAAGTNAVAGTGTAATGDLFGGKIKKDDDVTKYLFAKKDGGANANGSDADFAWTVDAKTGAVKMISKNALVKDIVKIAVKTATRSTKFAG